jgi:hypothetical protein
MAFLNSPCHETPKNAIKQKIEQNNRGREKKNGGKKAAFFVMSRDGLFRKKSFFRVFELPFLQNAQKKSLKIKIK